MAPGPSNFRESFCQAPQREGLTSREVPELPGKFGELPRKFGKLPGKLWIAVKFHGERTSGEVAKNFREVAKNFRGSRQKLPGKFGELPGTSQKLRGA